MVSSSDGLRLPPPWVTPAAGLPNREVLPVIIVQRRRLLYPAYVQDYLDRVTAADVAAGDSSGLEVGVTDAMSAFIQDLVSISYLGVSANVISQAASTIKAAPIMAGARTQPGALVPLVGAAPTQFGTAGGWNYNRKTGLLANGTNNYLNSNRNNNADPQNNKHFSVYATARNSESAFRSYIGTAYVSGTSYGSQLASGFTASRLSARFHDATTATSTGNLHTANGLFGASRSSSSNYVLRGSGINETITVASNPPSSNNMFVFARNLDGSPNLYSDGRVAFYSIGESLTLSLLEARLLTLINAFAAAIP
jgi:hypothetical protein